jgi:hypothetical protein
MAKKCIYCGHVNEDLAIRCVCGGDLDKATPGGLSAGSSPPADTTADVTHESGHQSARTGGTGGTGDKHDKSPLHVDQNPQLPTIPKQALPGYLFSGRTPHWGILVLILGDALWATVLCPLLTSLLTAGYVFIAVLLNALRRATHSGFASITLFAVVVAMLFMFAILIGVATAFYTYAVVLLGRVRKVKLRASLAFFSGVAGVMALPVYLSVFDVGKLLGTRYSHLPVEWWAYVAYIIVGIIAGFVGSGGLEAKLSTTPFCEECGRWYVDAGKAECAIDVAAPVAQCLLAGQANLLVNARMNIVSKEEFPRLSVQLRKCPNDCAAAYQLTIFKHFKVTRGKAAKPYTLDKHERWVDGMIGADVGKMFVEQLVQNRSERV